MKASMATRLHQHHQQQQHRAAATHMPSGPGTNEATDLLLRNPLTQGYTPTKYQSKSQLYSRNVRPDMAGTYHKSILEDDSPVTSFYTRHNPHPIRVKHLKGLLDNPVCMVEDNLERRLLWSAPSGDQLMAASYRPQGNTRYSANRTKHIPAIGIVPVTYAWKDELEKKAHNAISKALGQAQPSTLPVIQPHGYLTTNNPQDKYRQQCQAEFDSLDDTQLLNMLCKILQTDSIPACQAWLQNASDTEKIIVLNMLRMAATGEIAALNSPSNPQQQQQQVMSRPNTGQSVYIWDPHNQHRGGGGGAGTSLPPVNQHPQQQPQIVDHTHQHMEMENIDKTVFKLPVHDTIVRSAQSRLSMKHSDQPPQSFHDRLQNELDQVDISRRVMRTSSGRSGRFQSAFQRGRPTSAGPTPPGGTRPTVSQSKSNRPRSRSAGSSTTSNNKRNYYPPQLVTDNQPSPNMEVHVSSALRRPRAM